MSNADQSLKEMHRRSRVMEGDSKSFSGERAGIVRKHRQIVNKLKKGNDELTEELALETKHAMKSNSSQAAAQIAKLQDQADMYTRKIEVEKRRIEELDKQIVVMQKNVLEQRKKMGGVNAAKENHAQINKQIKILENRLDKALVKFNEALAHNKQLRETIDNLRRERVVFDQIYKKLERELAEKRKEMASIIEAANEAYAARDQAQEEMSKLKAKADQEQKDFEEEWKQLGVMIEEDRKRKNDFMKKGAKEGGEKDSRGDMSLDEETKLRKKVIKGNWGIAKDKAAQQVSLQKVQSYEEAFERIKQATGISEIDELVSTFIQAEEQNFSLFNYVNELNNEIEKLEEQVSDIKAEIEKYKGQGLNTENQRKKILKDLEDKLARTEAKSKQYEEKYHAAQKTVNALKGGIQSVFTKIGCDKMPQSEMLGTDGVQESNMMQYLGIIEQRTNEILQLYAQHQAAQQGKEGDPAAVAAILGQGPQIAAGATTLSINPPSTGDDFEADGGSSDDEDDRALTRQELKERAMRGIGRRAFDGGQKGSR